MNSATKVLQEIYNSKRKPSINTAKMWMLKLGYYQLTKIKDISNDWIIVIDHTIQMGKDKCLLILGIKTKDLPQQRALKYEDMEIIDLQPVKTSTGQIVYEQLEEVTKRIGVPRAIVSDMGSDIKNGVKLFHEQHNETIHIYDLKHKIAILVKKILEEDDNWSEFKKFANYIVKKLQNTTLAGYRPPKQREKARYMNIEELVKWGQQIIVKYKLLKEIKDKNEDELKLENILKDILNFKEDIKVWSEMVEIISIVIKFMNIHHLQQNSYEKFYELHHDKLLKIKTDKAKRLSTQILDFIKVQQKVCKKDEKLLHSSEIIESIFGKFKFLEKDQQRSSFTSLLLSIGAMVSNKGEAIVKTALETVTIPMIDKWSKEKIGVTVQTQKRELYGLN